MKWNAEQWHDKLALMEQRLVEKTIKRIDRGHMQASEFVKRYDG